MFIGAVFVSMYVPGLNLAEPWNQTCWMFARPTKALLAAVSNDIFNSSLDISLSENCGVAAIEMLDFSNEAVWYIYSSRIFIVQAKSSWLSVFFRTGKFEFSGSSFSNDVVVEVWASGNSSGGFKITISVDSQGQCWPLRWVAKIYKAVKDTSLHQDLYLTKERLQQMGESQRCPGSMQGI